MTDLEVHPAPHPPTKVNGTPALKPLPVDLTKPRVPRPTPVADEVAQPKPERVALWRRTGRKVRAAATHERTRAAGRVTVRHSMYVFGGGRIVTRRAWDGRTAARYERLVRAAETAGNMELAQEWEERGRHYRQARHRRRMELLKAPQEIAKGAAAGFGATIGGLLLLGGMLAGATREPADILTPISAFIDFVHWLIVVALVVWGPLLTISPALILAALWSVGRKAQTAPTWALPADAPGRDVVPDESAILNALRHLGIGPLNTAFKEGWQPRWENPTTRLGNGWHSRLQLPMGVTVEMITGKKQVLAHNLMRLPVEVWPTEPRDRPGVMDLWVADQGSLSGKVPPWPLLEEGSSDYFTGVPVGVSQRGDLVTAKLMAANYMVGGIMGTGKSSLVVALLLGAMLDPLVDIDVYVMAYNVDYDPMKPRLRTLVKGDEDEQVEAAMKALRGLVDEVTRRGKLLEDLGGDEAKLTRDMAKRDARMRPRVVVFDECHELFTHKKFGKEAAELAVKVMKKARKLGITLIWATVSPTAESIPKEVTRNTSHRAAFAVGDHIANDGLLGTGKHKAGITATTLNPAEDIGTTLTVGFTKNTFELIRSYWVRKDAEIDQITPVVQRALSLLDGDVPQAEPSRAVDHLADIAEVLGTAPRMRTQEVLQLLARHNPEEYRSWSFPQLRKVLDDCGHGEYKTDGGLMHVSRDRIQTALVERESEQGNTDDE